MVYQESTSEYELGRYVYDTQHVLGEGTFGAVYRGHTKQSGYRYNQSFSQSVITSINLSLLQDYLMLSRYWIAIERSTKSNLNTYDV